MVWSLSFSVHETVVNDFKKIMKNDALMVSSFIKNNNSKQIFWDIEIFFSFRPDEKEINLQISIFNIVGQHIKTLIDENQVPGFYSIIWEADNVSTGFYIVKLNTDSGSISQKVLLVK